MTNNSDNKLINFKEIKNFFVDLKDFLFAGSVEGAKYRYKIEKDLRKQIWPSVRFGVYAIGFTICFFVIWGGLAPLDSAVTAQGSVILSGNHKTIQHLEGGVIDKILVKEGDVVAENQDLIILNSTKAKAELDSALSRLRAEIALERRLIAEETDQETIDFSSEFLDTSLPEVQKIIHVQQSQFETRRSAKNGEIDSMTQAVQRHEDDARALEAQLKSASSQLLILREHFHSASELYNKNLTTKRDFLDAKSQVQGLEGKIAELNSKIAGAHKAVAETKLNIITVTNRFREKVAAEYKENHVSLLQHEQMYKHYKDVLDRSVIKAPTSGVVMSLQYHTSGGVIHTGSKIMDIVPQDDELILEAPVMPKDIESIKVGSDVKISLDAYKSRTVPRVAGKVIYISADKVFDERKPQEIPHYVVKIKVSEASLAKVNSDIRLLPGMPVTVFIIKGTRTFLQYLMSPITDSFHKAFKEV